MSNQLGGSLEKQEGNIQEINFAETISQAIADGRITIEKSGLGVDSRLPEYAKTLLEGISDEQVLEAIKAANFADSETGYIEMVDEKGRPSSVGYQKSETSLGVKKDSYMTLREDADSDAKISVYISLLHMHGKLPNIQAMLSASKKYPYSYPRAEDDGRCLNCEGWGCWGCGNSGGY